jgi:hypothetical protein
MRLESLSPFNSNNNISTPTTCLVTVAQIQATRLRLSIDGLDHTYDFWRECNSSRLFPVGHSHRANLALKSPSGHGLMSPAELASYLSAKPTVTELATAHINNKLRHAKIGMKLEAVDYHNAIFVRPATIVDIDTVSQRVKLHYDNWPSVYDVWMEKDAEDLHPVGWCEKTGHALTKPFLNSANRSSSTCPVPGCLGLGHAHGYKYANHFSESGCPYSLKYVGRRPRALTTPPVIAATKLIIKLDAQTSTSHYLPANYRAQIRPVDATPTIALKKRGKKLFKLKKRPVKRIRSSHLIAGKRKLLREQCVGGGVRQTDSDNEKEVNEENEIRESVYLAKFYDSVRDEERFVQKYNGRLVIGK